MTWNKSRSLQIASLLHATTADSGRSSSWSVMKRRETGDGKKGRSPTQPIPIRVPTFMMCTMTAPHANMCHHMSDSFYVTTTLAESIAIHARLRYIKIQIGINVLLYRVLYQWLRRGLCVFYPTSQACLKFLGTLFFLHANHLTPHPSSCAFHERCVLFVHRNNSPIV